MSTPNDGGSAFPLPTVTDDGRVLTPTAYENQRRGGMSLRDYFAVHATDRDVESTESTRWISGRGGVVLTREERRYVFADAMLAAREKREDSK